MFYVYGCIMQYCSESEIVYPSAEPEFSLVFCGVFGTYASVFCVVFSRSLIILFHLAIVLFVHDFTVSCYPLRILSGTDYPLEASKFTCTLPNWARIAIVNFMSYVLQTIICIFVIFCRCIVCPS